MRVKKILNGTLWSLLAIGGTVLCVDYSVWRFRMYNGANATDEIEVHLTYAAPLKGSKEAYYPDGTEMMVCSRTLLPEGGYEPCWWVARHREVVERP